MKVLLSGYYGFGNVGDEAVLEAIVNGLRQKDSMVEITVLSAAPRLTAEFYGVKALPRFRLPTLLRALRETDVLLSGGGTLFQDTTSSRSLWYYLAVVALAKVFGKKVMVFAQGCGPIRGPINRAVAGLVLDHVDLITVRDTDSAAELKRLGVRVPPLEVTGDPAALLPAGDRVEGRRILGLEGIALDRPLLGVALRGLPRRRGDEEQLYRELAAELDRLSLTYGLRPVFLLFQCPEDLEQARIVQSLMAQPGDIVFRICRPDEMLALFASLDLVIGMRLHALVFAALSGVPLVGLSYDPKVSAFMKTINQPCLSLDETADLPREVDRLLSRRNEVRAKLAGVRESMRRLAARNFELFRARLAP